jgi:hypothetical protein
MAGGSGRGHEHRVPPVPAHPRHCWVTGPADNPGPHPGQAIASEKRDGTWYVQVTYYLETDTTLVQQWVPLELVTRIGA